MLARKIRRAAERIVAKVVNREARADAVFEAHKRFAEEFRSLNAAVPEINKKLSASPSPKDREIDPRTCQQLRRIHASLTALGR